MIESYFGYYTNYCNSYSKNLYDIRNINIGRNIAGNLHSSKNNKLKYKNSKLNSKVNLFDYNNCRGNYKYNDAINIGSVSKCETYIINNNMYFMKNSNKRKYNIYENKNKYYNKNHFYKKCYPDDDSMQCKEVINFNDVINDESHTIQKCDLTYKIAESLFTSKHPIINKERVMSEYIKKEINSGTNRPTTVLSILQENNFK